MDYGDLLKRAWHIVWNNKFLLVLGFMAALSGGGSGGGGGGSSNFNVSSDSGPGDFNLPPGFAENIERYWAEFAGIAIGLVCLVIVLGIVFWLVSLVGQGGLISAVVRIDAGEKVTLSEAFAAGTGVLGRLVGLNLVLYGPFLLLGIIVFGIAAGLVGSAVFAQTTGAATEVEAIFGSLGIFGVCFAVFACLLVPLAILVNIIYPFAQRGLILQELSIMDSIRHGWRIIRENVGDVILLIIIFLVIGFGFGIAAALVLLPLAALAFAPSIINFINTGTLEVMNAIWLIGGGVCLGLLGAVINSIMVAYRSTTVTLAYQEFINKSGKLKAA